MATLGRAPARCLGDGTGQQCPGGHLGVERLGAGDAHLDVAAVARIHHAIGLVGEVAVAPVDDGQHRRTASASKVHRAIRVGGGAALADGDDEGVAHVEAQPEARQLCGRQGIDVESAGAKIVEHIRHTATGDGGGALADHTHLPDLATGETGGDVGRHGTIANLGPKTEGSVDQLAPQGLAEAHRRLADLLEQEVGEIAAVDVAGGHLGGDDFAS